MYFNLHSPKPYILNVNLIYLIVLLLKKDLILDNVYTWVFEMTPMCAVVKKYNKYLLTKENASIELVLKKCLRLNSYF